MTSTTAVLIPGNMCDARLWYGNEGALAHILRARGIAIVHVDATHDETIVAMAERALAAASGMLLPVGFSMGANVAIEMARREPERLAGLVLIDFNAGPDFPERAALRPGQQIRVHDGELANIVTNELKPAYLAAANRADGETPLKKLLLDMAEALGPTVFCQQSEALRTRADGHGVLASFSRPVLLLAGEEDALCPPDLHRATAATLAAATLILVPGAGHMLPLEQPAAMASAIAAWIDDHRGELNR